MAQTGSSKLGKETKIPLVDLATQAQHIHDEVMESLSDIMKNARFILGKEVGEFEKQFAEWCHASHCVGLANGTEALHMALRALNIGEGDEVIAPGNSFAATAFAIAYVGAKAVLVDIDPQDYNLDVTLLEQAITDNTRAIIPVHLYGQPARMKEIREIADRHGLKIVEDAAQAHGAEIDGQRVGSFGDIACFSFYPGKNLGAFGDGGAVVTNDDALAERLAWLRNYAQRVKNQHDALGYNCRLDTMQAGVLQVKMKYIDQWTESRRQVAAWYREELAGVDVVLPFEHANYRHVYHLFVIRHPQRDRLLELMAEENVFGGVHYPNPLSRAQPFVDTVTVPMGLPVTSQYAEEILSLPMYPEMTRDHVVRVAEVLKHALAQVAEMATA